MSRSSRKELYSENDVAKIVDAVGFQISPERQKELRGGLEQAAEKLGIQEALHSEPTAATLHKKFTKIENAATNLLKEIGAGPAGALAAIPNTIRDQLQSSAIKKAAPLGRSGRSILQDSILGVVRLKRWSNKLATSAAKRESVREEISGVARPRRSGSQTFKYWINDLSYIYRDIWGREPKLGWNEYTQTNIGGFFKFIRSAGAAIGVDKSDDALAMNIRRAKKIRDN